MNPDLKTRIIHSIVLATFVFAFVGNQVSEGQETTATPAGITFGDRIESEWEFGLKINASGNSRGIKATVPIPMNWPEQNIEIVREFKTQNVGKFRKSNPTRHTRQFSFNVNRISGRQPETGYIHFKVNKRFMIAPKDPSPFVIAKDVPTKERTFLKPSPYIESNDPTICQIAEDLKDESLTAWEQVETILRWVRDNVPYKFDTQIHTCLDALESGHGDCEELSSLFIAICRAQGIPARAVWVPGHTYPEFYLQDKSGNGHWFPCQAAGPYEFGAMSDPKPILQKGDRFKMPGERNKVRYVRPTLVARDAQGNISIQWIARQVNVTSGSKPK